MTILSHDTGREGGKQETLDALSLSVIDIATSLEIHTAKLIWIPANLDSKGSRAISNSRCIICCMSSKTAMAVSSLTV